MNAVPLTHGYRPLHTSSDLGGSVHLVIDCSSQAKTQATGDAGTGKVCFITVDVDLLHPSQLKTRPSSVHGQRLKRCRVGASPP